MLTDEWYSEIHQRLLADDPVAPAELVANVLDPVEKMLLKKYPALPNPKDISDAVVDAVVSYIKRPNQFDPSKRGLLGYLVMSAEGDLKNKLASNQRIREREVLEADVELDDSGRKFNIEDLQDVTLEPGSNNQSELEDLLSQAKKLFPEVCDQRVVELLFTGERSTSVFAEALALTQLPPDEQRKRVKQNKDRIKKRLERWKKKRK